MFYTFQSLVLTSVAGRPALLATHEVEKGVTAPCLRGFRHAS